jgi:DNA-binding GntR family transcriptional regulator
VDGPSQGVTRVSIREEDPLNYRSLPDALTDHIRRSIINGVLAAGDRLVETEWAARFRVSRATVRQALARLQAERLVELRPRRGAVVTRMSREAAMEVNEARGLLEAFAARDAVRNLTAADIEAMAATAQAMAEALAQGDVVGLVELDCRFHGCIVEHCHNRRIVDLWHGLDAQIGALLSSTLEVRRLTPERVKTRHLSLLGVLERRDPDLAEAEVRSHYMDIWPEEE